MFSQAMRDTAQLTEDYLKNPIYKKIVAKSGSGISTAISASTLELTKSRSVLLGITLLVLESLLDHDNQATAP